MTEPEKYDIFLSYEPEIKPSILKLYKELTTVHELKCWMDYHRKGEDSLSSGNFIGIKNKTFTFQNLIKFN